MTNTVVVVEYYENQYGIESKQVFKVFHNIEIFENYCISHNIRILKGAFGTTYYDDTHHYLAHHVELL